LTKGKKGVIFYPAGDRGISGIKRTETRRVSMSARPDKPQSDSKPKDSAIEKERIKGAFWLAIFGFSLSALLVIVLLAFGLKTSTDIVAIVGAFTSVLGTIVGAFLGSQVGSAGKAQAEERADSAQKKVNALAAAAPSAVIQEAKRLYGQDLFKK
jgi:hypothetical protein